MFENASRPLLLSLFLLLAPGLSIQADTLNDQGLDSLLAIIDKASANLIKKAADESAEEPAEEQQQGEIASGTIVNLSRTLGRLGYSRLQCGETGVLSEFTKRVQLLPVELREGMRAAFQEGFDRSKSDTDLISEDECKRLKESRSVGSQQAKGASAANVETDQAPPPKAKKQAAPEVVKTPEDEAQRFERIARITGQMASRYQMCGDRKELEKLYLQMMEKIPQDFKARSQKAYYKGLKQGRRLNQGFQCQG